MVFRFSSMYRALESGQAQRLLQPGQGGAGTAERVSLPKLHQKVNHDFLKQNVSFSIGVGALFGGGILNSHQGFFFSIPNMTSFALTFTLFYIKK